MGLDQYAYKRDADEDEDGNITIAEWRKHNRLQGWMEDLWEDKGRPYEGNLDDINPLGIGTDFNCIPVELTLSDIEQLEAHITNKTLPETGGFFFGADSYEEYEEYYKETDLQFVEDAREALGEGKKIFYSSWW
jgi:hypothetical protein|tara:strand:- start:231 stop:632 length:402 start_codon:yes stop_codon:yes gene_type:complete